MSVDKSDLSALEERLDRRVGKLEEKFDQLLETLTNERIKAAATHFWSGIATAIFQAVAIAGVLLLMGLKN